VGLVVTTVLLAAPLAAQNGMEREAQDRAQIVTLQQNSKSERREWPVRKLIV
jgi:hypothetical protein